MRLTIAKDAARTFTQGGSPRIAPDGMNEVPSPSVLIMLLTRRTQSLRMIIPISWDNSTYEK